MANRFADVLERFETGAVIQPGDRDLIREALESQIARVAYVHLGDEWLIGQEKYANWVGFRHVHKLITRPGERIHVAELTDPRDPENARTAVQKSIRRAVQALVNTQPVIGLHLQNNIRTGGVCGYFGNWIWEVVP